jgi:PTH1 family peptidyl-tRNA hydrolase
VSTPIELIVGLGNPGPRYDDTRHDAGFWFVERVAARVGVALRSNARFRGAIVEAEIGGRRVRLLQPETFMNLSGDSVAAVAAFYRYAPGSVLVAHDEIDLPPGTVRLKRGGGHGGHNGLRDVIPKLGDPGFVRLRIGVGHPGSADRVTGYVLGRPGADEHRLIDSAIDDALEQLEEIVGGSLERAMTALHSRAPPDGDAAA